MEPKKTVEHSPAFLVGEPLSYRVFARFSEALGSLELEVVEPDNTNATFEFDSDNAAELEDLANWLLEGARRLRAGKGEE